MGMDGYLDKFMDCTLKPLYLSSLDYSFSYILSWHVFNFMIDSTFLMSLVLISPCDRDFCVVYDKGQITFVGSHLLQTVSNEGVTYICTSF